MHFIRHGESTFNVQRAALGRDPQIPDAPLTDRGIEQVRSVARNLGPRSYDVILSSPYTRALHTATLLAEVIGAPILVEPLVGEWRLYSCDIGSPLSQLKENWKTADFSAMETEDWWQPFTETEEALEKRIRSFRQSWAQEKRRLLVASHWHFIYNATGQAADNAQLVPWEL
jgi:broad specificity phosphatase PhoE